MKKYNPRFNNYEKRRPNAILCIEDGTVYLEQFADVDNIIRRIMFANPLASCVDTSDDVCKTIEVTFPEGSFVPERFVIDSNSVTSHACEAYDRKGWPVRLTAKEEFALAKKEKRKDKVREELACKRAASRRPLRQSAKRAV